jgi:transcriptional regulator with XRE-family HTH domain
MNLYERIKEIAKNKGYSINALEKELGYARSSISKFKDNTPSVDKIRDIAEFLGVSMDLLMGLNESDISDKKYYINEETQEMAQAIFTNKELRLLFDEAMNAQPEDLKATHDILLALKRKERGTD